MIEPGPEPDFWLGTLVGTVTATAVWVAIVWAGWWLLQ